jgi:outer membrane murein-binding lipoprotein Lpp
LLHRIQELEAEVAHLKQERDQARQEQVRGE